MTTVSDTLDFHVEGDSTTIGRMVVLGVVDGLAKKMPGDQVTDVVLGMIATCAGLIAMMYGPAAANEILKRLPDISAEAMAAAMKSEQH